jgi:hypothetical protein
MSGSLYDYVEYVVTFPGNSVNSITFERLHSFQFRGEFSECRFSVYIFLLFVVCSVQYELLVM